MTNWDVIIIGGGPAGLMAAASAAGHGARTLLLEKGTKLGRKLIISGGGRCNVTNRKPVDELVQHIPGNGRFMFSAFHTFGNEEIIRFFEGLGVNLKEEDNGRMFPVTDKAVTVANALIDHLRRQGVQIRLGAAVERVTYGEQGVTGVLLKTGEHLTCRAVVVAVGGKSVPQTGSTGDGYAWAAEAGHTITDFYPTEVPLKASDPFIREKVLQGLSLRDITMTLWDPKGKRITAQRGDMIFTHFGLSGPCALRISHYVSVTQKKLGRIPLRLTIDLFADKSAAQVQQEATALLQAEPKKAVKNVLKGFLPERMIPLLLSAVEIPETTTQAHISNERWSALCRLVKAFPVTITGTLSIEEAFVTGGGVSVKEIDPSTMASKIMPGLHFAGEIMDVHGHTGGYNITVAFSSGYVAGMSAAEHALDS